MELGRQRVAAQAVGLLNPEWVATVNDIYKNPERYLDDKLTAIRPRTKEFVTLALVRLASTDAHAAPLIDPRFLTHADDLAQMIAGVRQARRILQAPALSAYGREWPSSAQADRCSLYTTAPCCAIKRRMAAIRSVSSGAVPPLQVRRSRSIS